MIKSALIIFSCLVLLVEVNGQEVEGQKPSLNDHTFIPVSYMASPFFNTRLTMPIGIGSTSNFNFDETGNPALDTIDGLNGSVLFVNLGMRYSQKLQDWINFYMNVGLTARLGTNVESILSQGFNTVINVKVGSMIKLYDSKKTMLSMSVDVSNYGANFMDINGFVGDIIDGVPDPQIVRKIPALTAGAGLHFAWGINDLFGVTAAGSYAYGETFTRGQSGGRYSIKTGVDVNFNKRFQVPLGLALGYVVTTDAEIVYVDDRSGTMLFWKIAYTGRKDFDIGIETGVMTLPFDDVEEKPKVIVTSFTISYFFN